MNGVSIASSVIVLWATHLLWCLSLLVVDLASPLTYFHIIVQAYLYTGLFITAHDSLHGSISTNRTLNRAFGQLSLWLFAAFRYERMFTNHMAHHKWPGTAQDPDFSVEHQHPVAWFLCFFFRYVTFIQLLTMALLFNLLHYVAHVPVSNLIAFWVIPAFAGTFQLFYFGTYLPHRYPHTPKMAPYNSRTLRRNHVWAMLSCWFFGYHWEHHASPHTPWWRLYATKPKTD